MAEGSRPDPDRQDKRSARDEFIAAVERGVLVFAALVLLKLLISLFLA